MSNTRLSPRWSSHAVETSGVRKRKFVTIVEWLVSVERLSCSRGASCVVKYTMRRWSDWSLQSGGLVAEVLYVWWNTLQ